MKIMSGIRLVIADVDGTLVNDHRELSSYTKSVIERLHEQEFCLVLPPAEIIFNCCDFPFDVTMGMNADRYILQNPDSFMNTIN